MLIGVHVYVCTCMCVCMCVCACHCVHVCVICSVLHAKLATTYNVHEFFIVMPYMYMCVPFIIITHIYNIGGTVEPLNQDTTLK